MEDIRPTSDDAVDVVLSEERLVAGTQVVERARVRVSKRVVVEERTVTVQVRREELVVEEVPSAPDAVAAGRPATPGPVLELVLAEEEVEVVTRVVPRERVRVYVDTVESAQTVSTTLAHEEVDLDAERGPRR
ncbi:DUF2382 domain-containing protein [Cellulomonas sp. ATA003]|uniref:DUF2382 domain-containing protein n=1 Tax=Cellulomonas sp. ATA003 TaxID=3073064 RepID=UPI002873CB10|nr:DUF2382 domain-containing protein [Cellulomonas sp. ATA003]WNB86699.1 DUF2382 domain-containing protein [Cellulomonas sp. ATA003]